MRKYANYEKERLDEERDMNSTLQIIFGLLGGLAVFIYGMNMVFNLYTRFLVDRLSLHYEPSYLRAIFITILFLFVCHYLYQILNQNRIARAALLGKFY